MIQTVPSSVILEELRKLIRDIDLIDQISEAERREMETITVELFPKLSKLLKRRKGNAGVGN